MTHVKHTFLYTISCIALGLMVAIPTTTAWSFGGHGGGSSSNYYKRHKPGVSSLGIHRHEDGHSGDFNFPDLSNDPEAEYVAGVWRCKAGRVLSVDHCVLCNPGTYSAAGDESCTPAPAGYYVPNAGMGHPTICPADTYQPEAGQTECLPVDPGYQPAPEPPAAPSDEVPCTDTTTPGACGCEETHVADGQGNCVCPPNYTEKQGSCVSSECTSNDDCAGNTYCKFTGTGSTKGETGTCESLGSYADATITGLGTVRKSDNMMSQWAAASWCEKQGLTLIDAADLKCYSGDSLLPGSSAYAYCCAKGKSCGSWTNYWTDATTISPEYVEVVNMNYSPVLIALRKELGKNDAAGYDWSWTSSVQSATKTFYIYFTMGILNTHFNPSNEGGHALCMVEKEVPACTVDSDCADGEKCYDGQCSVCPPNNYMSTLGECRSCDNPESTGVLQDAEAEACQVCPNRTVIEMAANGLKFCALTTCPTNTYRVDNGSCYACNSNAAHGTTTEQACAACDNTATPRKIFDPTGKPNCGLITCPENYFHHESGDCLDCFDASEQVETTESECALCSNRKWNETNGTCDLKSCTTNNDCADDEFCKFTGSGSTRNETGTCESLGSYADATIDGLGTVRKSDDMMSQWAAASWCEKQGASLIDVKDIGCYSGNNLVTKQQYAYCCAQGKSCKSGSWDSYWTNETTINPADEELVNENYSPILIALRKALGAGDGTTNCSGRPCDWAWTGTSYNASKTLYVYLTMGMVNTHFNPSNEGGHALCKLPMQCGEHEIEEDGSCVCDNVSGYYGPTGGCILCSADENKTWNGTECVCAEGYIDDGTGICQKVLNCSTNNDCADGEFCKFTGSDSTRNETGTCESLGSYADATIAGLGTVRKSDNMMSYWAAANWCEKQGGSLIETSDLGCYSGDTLQIKPVAAYCCAQGKSCKSSSWNDYWSDATTIKPDSEDIVNTNYSPVLVALRKALGKNDAAGYDWSWTNTPYDSAKMMYVYFTYGNINRNFKPSNEGGHALCKMPLYDPTDCTGKADGTTCIGESSNMTCYNGSCVESCDIDQFRDTTGSCKSCNESSTSVEVAKPEDCTCSNRVYYNNKCVLASAAEPYSNCQTAEIINNTLVRGFLPKGTACTQSGLSGTCNGWGQCVPTNGTACTSNDSCPAGYFCHLGGNYYTKRNDDEIGLTPNVCELVQPLTFTHEGKTYYYNSKADLISWCRPADGNKNCIWGYLAYQGATNWCASIGKRLLTKAEMSQMCDVLNQNLPHTSLTKRSYWIADSADTYDCITGTLSDSGRGDGYSSAGGVVCVGDDPTDCTGKADGTVCSDTNPAAVCRNGECADNCTSYATPYEGTKQVCCLHSETAYCANHWRGSCVEMACCGGNYYNSQYSGDTGICCDGTKVPMATGSSVYSPICCEPDQTFALNANNEAYCVDQDITNCTGKADGTVCSAVDSSLLDNPSHQLPVCINGNCECLYEGWGLDVGENICIPEPGNLLGCNKLTEKGVLCSVSGDGSDQHVDYNGICISKDNAFTGATGYNGCTGRTLQCKETISIEGQQCCTEYECISTCTKNNDCADGEYCKFKGTSSTKDETGTCESLGTYVEASIAGLGTVRKSDDMMSYWAAANWCEKQGMTLVETSDIGCYNGNTLQTNPTYYYCCAQGKSCAQSTWNGYWSDATTIKPEYEELVNENYSPTLIALRQALGKNDAAGYDWSWTNTVYDKDKMMYVYFTYGNINRNFRPSNEGGHALCK